MLNMRTEENLKSELFALFDSASKSEPHFLIVDLMPVLFSNSKQFKPHPSAQLVEQETKAWAQRYNVWLDKKGEEGNNLFVYLHASSDTIAQLTVTGRLNALLFFMDDLFGNELLSLYDTETITTILDITKQVIAALEQVEQAPENPMLVDTIVANVEKSPLTQLLRGHLTGIIYSLKDIMDDMQHFLLSVGQIKWFSLFLTELKLHLHYGLQDFNIFETDVSVEQYATYYRNYSSGMNVSLRLAEYVSGVFFTPEFEAQCEQFGVSELLNGLRFRCLQIGGLANDVVSYEKEVREAFEKSGRIFSFNLVAVTWFHQPDLTLLEAWSSAATFVDNLVIEFFTIREKLIAQLENTALDASDDQFQEFKANLLKFVHGALNDLVYATGKWQLDNTDRYVHSDSIFAELRTTV